MLRKCDKSRSKGYKCKIEILEETFETTQDVVKIIKDSSQQNTKFSKIREESNNLNKSIHAFHPKRWTVRGETLRSALNNFEELLELWDQLLNNFTDTEVKKRA